ncbi:ABC-2 type transport system ATP-binding protein [Verrucomicrobium sp. GAS474]|uniref:ABC transporter ATP-binding protein n=1 Tax=Verrucomicrobium sp. GAS474 TaxID=1882831 RepID=UPI00087D99BA|nr:ABC transporter ATP-binding protein [Verrucomicrobium sp. GAS474]SDT86938.1 ABC-2 type transport system ATP-binding protein [Verrucomicrobium sp. GAS474]
MPTNPADSFASIGSTFAPDSGAYAIEAVGLRRSFGKTEALRDLTLRVPKGGVYGFLGRNGAGKTTAIRLLAGLIKPDAGTVRILGQDPFTLSPEDRQRVGYVSEKQILPANMKVATIVSFCAPLYPRWDAALVRRLFDRFRIDPKKPVSTLSQGGQRQVALVLALAQRPELLILDEPASTLDAVARRELLGEILDLLRAEGDAGSRPTVFLSSHILSDIERVADRVGILADGRLKIDEPLDTLKETVKRVRFHSFPANTNLAALTPPGAYEVIRERHEIAAILRLPNGEGDPAPAEAFARAHGAQCEITDLNLEDLFVALSKTGEMR